MDIGWTRRNSVNSEGHLIDADRHKEYCVEYVEHLIVGERSMVMHQRQEYHWIVDSSRLAGERGKFDGRGGGGVRRSFAIAKRVLKLETERLLPYQLTRIPRYSSSF